MISKLEIAWVFDIFSDSKSSIVICILQWVSQEIRGSELYNIYILVKYQLIILQLFSNTTQYWI